MLEEHIMEIREIREDELDQLLDAVWGYHVYPTSRTIDNFIMKLRKIFEDDPARPEYFETIRGVGYRFKVHIDDSAN